MDYTNYWIEYNFTIRKIFIENKNNIYSKAQQKSIKIWDIKISNTII